MQNEQKVNAIFSDFKSIAYLFFFVFITTILSTVNFFVLNVGWLFIILLISDLILLILILLVHKDLLPITSFIITDQIEEIFILKKRNKERIRKKINKWNKNLKSYRKDVNDIKDLIPKTIMLTLIYYLLIFFISFEPSALTGYGTYFIFGYWAFILLFALVFLSIMVFFNMQPMISGGIFWGLYGLSFFGLKVLNHIPLVLIFYITGKKSSEMNEAINNILQKTLIIQFILAILNIVGIIGIIIYSFINSKNFNFNPKLMKFKLDHINTEEKNNVDRNVESFQR